VEVERLINGQEEAGKWGVFFSCYRRF
jgi:hypothetical protein